MVDGLRPAVPTDRRITEEPAQQHPPALRACRPRNRKHPTQRQRIAHRSFERKEASFQVGEVVALVVADVGDVYIPGELPDCLDVRRFIGVAAVGNRPVKAGARHLGIGREPFAPLSERARRKDRHRVPVASNDGISTISNQDIPMNCRPPREPHSWFKHFKYLAPPGGP